VRRHRFAGHVFQGRYRAELVEDETYLWSVTRYVHLNPVRAGLAGHPSDWTWSSYPGYVDRRRRLEWMAYEDLLRSVEGAFGGSDAAGSYRRYVTAGLAEPPPSPWLEAKLGWILGSAQFVARLGELVRGEPPRERRRESRLVQGIPLRRVCELVCESYGVAPTELSRRGSRHEARPVLAHLARQYTEATLAELAPILGVSRPESVPNLTRRFDAWLSTRKDVRLRLKELEAALCGTTPTREKTKK
jgi:hypothetical protein